ncbi:unnamed protein product [Discosporangium mesarthrocarpum]
MFEQGGFDHEDMGVGGMHVMGALALGLGDEVGMRVCVLHRRVIKTRPKRRSSHLPPLGSSSATAPGSSTSSSKVGGPGTGEKGSQDEQKGTAGMETEVFESQLVFQSASFLTMLSPHLRTKRPAATITGDKEQVREAEEALTTSEELVDRILRGAFEETISSECPQATSPQLGRARVINSMGQVTSTGFNIKPPLDPALGEHQEESEEEDDADLPKVLGERTWVKEPAESKKEPTESKKKPAESKESTKVSSSITITCVLSSRKPSPVVVYIARTSVSKPSE